MDDLHASQFQHNNLDDPELTFQMAVTLGACPAFVSHCGGDDGDGDDGAAAVAVVGAGYKLQLLAEGPNSCLQTILPRF